MKRTYALLLSLLLLFPLAVPCLAASGTVEVLAKGNGVMVGRRATRPDSAAYELVWSKNGTRWSPMRGEPIQWGMGLSQIQYTGRDFFLCTDSFRNAYTSTDGMSWTALPSRGWFLDNTRYTTAGAIFSGRYQLLWTGTEYMMMQFFQDDIRDISMHYGMSPRNKLVTFLDKNYQIIGAKSFDSDVTSIRFQKGLYYAGQPGGEVSFTKADWYPNIVSAEYVSNGEIIFRRGYLNGGLDHAYSTDGRSWCSVTPAWSGAPDDVSLLPSTMGHIFVENRRTGELFATRDCQTWITLKPGDRPWHDVVDHPLSSHTFRTAGDGYILCQRVINTGGMTGRDRGTDSPRNKIVSLLDGNFNLLKEHDFGAQVEDVGAVGKTYYAKVQRATDTGDSVPSSSIIWSSTDFEHWTRTALTNLPTSYPVPDGNGLLALAPGDSPTRQQIPNGNPLSNPMPIVHPTFVLRIVGEDLLASEDGVYFTKVALLPKVAGQPAMNKVSTYPGAYGVLLQFSYPATQGYDCDLYPLTPFAWSELSALIRAKIPYGTPYVTLNGSYLSPQDLPYLEPPLEEKSQVMASLRTLAEALDFSTTWDTAKQHVLCEKNGRTLLITPGSTEVLVDGVPVTMDLPAARRNGWVYVPLRFIGETFGFTVDWNRETHTAALSTKTGG